MLFQSFSDSFPQSTVLTVQLSKKCKILKQLGEENIQVNVSNRHRVYPRKILS